MKNKTREFFQIKSRSIADSKRLLVLLPVLALLWVSSCTLFQKQENLPQSISEQQYIDIMLEYGLHPQRNPSLPHTPIPFRTVAEARTYVAEVAKYLSGQSDGKVLHELQVRYPAPQTLEQQTSLKLIPLYAILVVKSVARVLSRKS